MWAYCRVLYRRQLKASGVARRNQIIKVKSHIGIKGNEEADRLAHDACKSVNCNEQVLAGLPIREHIHWPLQRDCSYTNNGHNANRRPASCEEGTERPDPLSLSAIPRCKPEDGGTADFTPDHQVNDLRKGMKSLIRPVLATGYAINTVYVQAWKDTNAHTLGKPSNHFWNSPIISQVLKYRLGQLWNMKMAFCQRRPYLPGWPIPRFDRCPHCHQPDSGGTSWEGAGTEC